MYPLYRAGQRDTCIVRSQPVTMFQFYDSGVVLDSFWNLNRVESYSVLDTPKINVVAQKQTVHNFSGPK